jgi:sugar lactone lactonase YvrE
MNVNNLRSRAALALWLMLAACAPLVAPPLADRTGPASFSVRAAPAVYAFSPQKGLVATYSAGGRGRTKPVVVLDGPKTQLSMGNGMAVDADGTIYALVYESTSSNAPVKLVVFPPNAKGDTAPERTAVLRGPVLPGYANGLALDGHGNFWVSAIGKLLRYPTSASGRVRPNAAISVQLDTPYGYMPANASNVALDTQGDVYCSCAVVFHGNQAIGVSEYALGSHKAILIRSFYDLVLPEVPPTSIAIDGSGTIYLASPLPNTGVFAYAASTRSGDVRYSRRFVWRADVSISTLATDASGNVYVGAGSRVAAFGPNSNGHAHPSSVIFDPKHLEYGDGTYGTLLSIH